MFAWMKRYLPRGLYGRAALILILPVVALQLVVSTAFIQRHFEGVTQQMVRSVSLELGYLRDIVEAAPDLPAARAALAPVAEALEVEVILPSEAIEGDRTRWVDLTGGIVIRTLRETLEGLGPVDLSDERRVRLWLETGKGLMEVDFARSRLSASNPHQLLVIMVLIGALMVLIAFIYLRNQLRPISRMAAAASAYGQGRILPFRPSGATEVRIAGQAFLDMRNRIERHTQQRTLMLSGVSHDLRTPLTRLKLGLSLMDEEEATPLRRDVDDMEVLLDGFLDYARSDVSDALEEVDPVALVEDVVARARKSGQAVEVHAPEGLPSVTLKPMAVRRALWNLIGNALRYGTRAEVSVAMTKAGLVLTVEDDGPGIPPENREAALRPFTRLDPSRNQNRGAGVGLGLAIVLDIARGHGGSLTLGESERLGGLKVDLALGR